MGFFYKAGGGGGGNDPTYPAAPLVLAADSASTSFTLTNSGTTPASVELSFASDTGSSSLLIGSNYDQGTDRSPTYVVDPDAGSRTVSLIRGGTVSSDPSSTETVTLTSNAGVLPQTLTVTVFKLSAISVLVRAALSSIPTIEYTYNGVLTNSGSLGSSFDLTGSNLTVASSTDYGWAVGAAKIDTTGGHGATSSPQSSTNWNAGQDRTWVLVWKNDGTISANLGVWIQAKNSGNNGPGYIKSNAGGTFWGVQSSTYDFNSADGEAYPLATDTATGLTLPSGELNVLCCSYNHSTNLIKYMYKSSNQARGQHTYREEEDTTSPSTANYTYYGIGNTSAFSAQNSKVYYNAIYDRQTTNAEFQTLLDVLGV